MLKFSSQHQTVSVSALSETEASLPVLEDAGSLVCEGAGVSFCLLHQAKTVQSIRSARASAMTFFMAFSFLLSFEYGVRNMCRTSLDHTALLQGQAFPSALLQAGISIAVFY